MTHRIVNSTRNHLKKICITNITGLCIEFIHNLIEIYVSLNATYSASSLCRDYTTKTKHVCRERRPPLWIELYCKVDSVDLEDLPNLVTYDWVDSSGVSPKLILEFQVTTEQMDCGSSAEVGNSWSTWQLKIWCQLKYGNIRFE